MESYNFNLKSISESMHLWKYLSLHKFLYFFLKKRFYFSRLDLHEDALEGVTQRYLNQKNLHQRFLTDKFIDTNHKYFKNFFGDIDKEYKKLQSRQSRIFISSWIMAARESAALWNVYSEPGSVALKIKPKRLIDFLHHSRLDFNGLKPSEGKYGNVEYKDFVNSSESRDFLVGQTAFRKDLSFKHEDEFRIVIKFDKAQKTPGIDLPIDDIESLNVAVVFHPKTSEWQKENITDLIEISDHSIQTSDSELSLK